jgi:DnaA family protein
VKQLALSLAPASAPTLDNFVAGRNGELLDALARLARGEEAERIFYLWGAPGSGKSHLLKALATTLKLGYAVGRIPESPGPLVIDDVHTMNETEQGRLFPRAFSAREQGTLLVAAGDVPPARLNIRADVATRLGSGLVYEVHILSDDEKAVALQSYAMGRGMSLRRELVQYLLTHGSRDLRMLLTVVDALDQLSLESKRPVTLPLLREVLKECDPAAP